MKNQQPVLYIHMYSMYNVHTCTCICDVYLCMGGGCCGGGGGRGLSGTHCGQWRTRLESGRGERTS